MQLMSFPWKHKVQVRRNEVPAQLGGDPFQSEFDAMVERFFGPQAGLGVADAASRAWAMPVDILETGEGYRLRVELPGVDPKDVEVTLNEGVLTVQGEKRGDEQREGETRHISERRFGTFRRAFVMPNAVDESKVTAKFESGVLQIDVAKLAPVKPRRIEIQAS